MAASSSISLSHSLHVALFYRKPLLLTISFVLIFIQLPQQENLFDCGLFLLHYVERFLEEASLNFSPFNITKFSNFVSNLIVFKESMNINLFIVFRAMVIRYSMQPHQSC